MHKYKLIFYFILIAAAGRVFAIQEADVPSALKDAALHDAACTTAADGQNPDSTSLGAAPIRLSGRDLGTIVTVHGACHCHGTNCDTLVYLHSGEGYRLALHEKYASLHPMKIVKRGMPSLTGQFELSSATMETTVYDWDGKDYHPSLCATVMKHGRVPTIARHPCRAPAQADHGAR
jgi:hypothetical protein